MFLDLLLRWIHIFSAITLVGGTFFLCFALAPAIASQATDSQRALLEAWRPRWARLVMITSGLLLLSGLANAVRIILDYDFGEAPYHALVAVKLLLAMGLFWISAVLSGRSELAGRFRQRMSFWLNIAVVLAVLTVALAGYMKMVPRTPKPADPAASVARIESGDILPSAFER